MFKILGLINNRFLYRGGLTNKFKPNRLKTRFLLAWRRFLLYHYFYYFNVTDSCIDLNCGLFSLRTASPFAERVKKSRAEGRERVTEPVHRLLKQAVIYFTYSYWILQYSCSSYIFTSNFKKNNTYILISVGKSSKTDKEVFHTKHWCQSIKTQDSRHYMLIWKGKTQVNNEKNSVTAWQSR